MKNRIFNGAVLTFTIGLLMDVLMVWWAIRTFDVVPDWIEYDICKYTEIGVCYDRGDFAPFESYQQVKR